jgi:hypothetical protein
LFYFYLPREMFPPNNLDQNQSMKTTFVAKPVIFLLLSLLASLCQAADITATNSGNWSDTNIWSGGVVPGANDDADIQGGVNVVVDTNVTVQFIYDSGTVTMGPNSTLVITTDNSISSGTGLNATASGNTVMYTCNPFNARVCNYYNLILNNTNWTPPTLSYLSHYENFNNFYSSSVSTATPMTVYGNMTLMGYVKVQEANVAGVPINIGGNLTIGSGCAWDCSSGTLNVTSNLYLCGLLEDLDGANGSNNIGGNVLVMGPTAQGKSAIDGYTNGWYLGDVVTWGVGGSLTNDGAIYGIGYASIFFNGTGSIGGSNVLTLPTMTISPTGHYTIADTIMLTTNNANFFGSLTFDLATTNQIDLIPYPGAGTTLTNYYAGGLNVINSGSAPTAGETFQLFSGAHYTGTFIPENLPPLPAGLYWIDNLLTTGSLVVGGTTGHPTLSVLQTGNQLKLSWNSATYSGYQVQAQTNGSGLGNNWSPTGIGTTSPYVVTINPTNPAVFYRLSNP